MLSQHVKTNLFTTSPSNLIEIRIDCIQVQGHKLVGSPSDVKLSLNPSPSSSALFFNNMRKVLSGNFRLRHIAHFRLGIVLDKLSIPSNIKTTSSISLTKWLKYSARCTLSEKRRATEIRKTWITFPLLAIERVSRLRAIDWTHAHRFFWTRRFKGWRLGSRGGLFYVGRHWW